MDIAELDLARVLSPFNDDAAVGFIVHDGTDRIISKILQQPKTIAGILAQLFP